MMEQNIYKTIKAALDYSMTPEGIPIKAITFRWERINIGNSENIYKPMLNIEFASPKIIEVKPNKE